MTYLYGDSTGSPFTSNVLELLRDAIDLSVYLRASGTPRTLEPVLAPAGGLRVGRRQREVGASAVASAARAETAALLAVPPTSAIFDVSPTEAEPSEVEWDAAGHAMSK